MKRSSAVSGLRTGAEEQLKTALVTGATGLVGSATCLALAKEGWRMALVCRSKGPSVQALLRKVRKAGGRGILLQADLGDYRREAPRAVAEAQQALGPIHLFVHAAAPPVTVSGWQAPPEDLDRQFAIQAGAFMALASALLPEMLRAQSGTLVALLSQALLPPLVPGWQSYTMAKAALAQAVNELTAAYSAAGIRTVGLMPGVIKNGRAQRPDTDHMVPWSVGLSAETVAKWVLRLATDPGFSSGTVISLDFKGSASGRSVIWVPDRPSTFAQGNQDQGDTSRNPKPQADGVAGRLHEVVRKTFGLEPNAPVERARIGELHGWDSLGHVKLIMEIEAAFRLRFTAAEAVSLQSVPGIVEALSRHASKS